MDKVWINLKPFIQEAYQRRLNTTGNTSGQHGYVQNAFAVLEESDDAEDEDVAMVITQMAALTTQSQLTTASTVATSSSVAAAIHQLNSNQLAMMQQMATYANVNTTRNPPAVHNPPLLTHFNIPAIGTFQPGGNAQGGRRPRRGRGGRAPVISPGGRRAPRTPFAGYLARQGGMDAGIVPAFVPGVPGVGAAARNMAPMYSNIVKRYSNMNVCFSCGFDVENGHTSLTCPQAWRRANHQEAYNWSNAQQYIDAGYDACTKAKHKTQLPAF